MKKKANKLTTNKCEDELAERLQKATWLEWKPSPVESVTWKKVADEARRWAEEVVEKTFRESDEVYDRTLLDEVLERLKGRE